jgi:cytochrome b subunit of formate dehydrogenase
MLQKVKCMGSGSFTLHKRKRNHWFWLIAIYTLALSGLRYFPYLSEMTAVSNTPGDTFI